MTLTFPMFTLSNLKWMFCATIAKPNGEVPSDHDKAYAEREFLRELMDNNPEAVQSDLGLMAMMTLYPRNS